jgi:hypothetical protein
MSRYTLWSRQNKREEREFHEKAFRREGLAEWDGRWHKLSSEARTAVLNTLKLPPRSVGPNSVRPCVSVESILPATLEELVASGFAEIGASRMIGPRDKVFTTEAATDFVIRVRSLQRHHLLGAEPPDLKRYIDHGYFVSVALDALNSITRRAGIHEYLRLDDVLSRYVTGRHWPEWAVASVADPFAGRVLKAIEDADAPIPMVDLPAKVGDVAPDSVRTSLDRLISVMAVFEDLDPKTLDIVVGLLPSVREAMSKARLPRVRPELVEVRKPKEVGPDSSIVVDDLRAFLLETVSEPPLLRQDRSLYQKEVGRFVDAMGPIPAWLPHQVSRYAVDRESQALTWARSLGLVKERVEGSQTRLEISSKGSQWLASPLEEQYNSVFRVLNVQRSKKRRNSYDEEYENPALAQLGVYSYGSDDQRFLGSNVVAIQRTKDKDLYRYWEARPEDHKALRDSLDRAFSSLPEGVFFTLGSVLGHLAFGEANPLFLGLGRDEVQVYQSSVALPPIEERQEEVARQVMETFIRTRLIPLGCIQAAIDSDSHLSIARLPRLDAYFGRTVDAEKMAGVSAGETRVVVQPDFSIVIIGLNPAPAAELAPFCERPRKGGSAGAVVLNLTRESVVKAVAGGMAADQLVGRLKRLASNEVPPNVLRQVLDWAGWVRHVKASTKVLLRCPDAATADRVAGALKKRCERLNETVVALEVGRIGTAERNKLKDQGIILQSGKD